MDTDASKPVAKEAAKQGRIEAGSVGWTFEVESQAPCATPFNSEVWDDMSGKQLNMQLVAEAREEEMKEVFKHQVYTKVPIQQCLNATGKPPIGTRWVDVNKGDDLNPEYRSRLVAQELKKNSWADDLFAATPPLEAKKVLFALAVTEGIGFKEGKREKRVKD